MPSEEDKKVVKLASMSKELKVLSQMNYSLRKKNNEQKGQISLLQKERDASIIRVNNAQLVAESQDYGPVAELQEELRRSENTRKNQKELLQKILVCLDEGMKRDDRVALLFELMKFGKVSNDAAAKFEIIPEQPIEEKKLIADAAEAVEKIDADELEAAAANIDPKEDNDDTGK